MKRSVIQLAGRTSVISLPSKWIQKYGVKKGDELELEEKENGLFIATKNFPSIKKAVLDARALNPRTLRWALSGLHKSGYDEIEVLYEKKETLNVVQNLLRNIFVGFAVMDQNSKKFLLKSISADVEREFDPVLRRAFLITISFANSVCNALKLEQYKVLQDLMPKGNVG